MRSISLLVTAQNKVSTARMKKKYEDEIDPINSKKGEMLYEVHMD